MRSVFIGIGGFLGRIDGETRCAFWADEPVDHGFDPKLLITVDLARTPSAAAAREISWDAVQLNRETVRDLTPDEQKGIKGGLVVTSIIGVLIGLLLPAVQNARDAR